MRRLLVIALLMMVLVPGAHAQDQVEITFVHVFGDENDIRGQVVQELVDDFMAEYPGVVVNIQTTISDYEEVLTTTVLAAEQDDAPHVVHLDETAVLFAVDSGHFLNISEVASDEQQALLDDLLPVVRESNTVAGQLWSVPWSASNPLLFYNKAHFEQAGLNPEVPPQTFDEVLAACETLMAADLGLSACINWPLTSWFVEVWVAMQGGLLVDSDNGHSDRATQSFLTSPEITRVFEWWDDMAERGYYLYTGKTADYTGEAASFATRRTAMHINAGSGLTNFQYYAGLLGYELGVAPLPMPTEDATVGTLNPSANLWITNGHSDAETQASIDLVFFMARTENIAAFHRATGYFPTSQGAIDMLRADGFWEENPDFYVSVAQMLDTTPGAATAGAVIGPHNEIRGILQSAVQSMIDQGEAPADVLAAAKQLADAEIDDYNFFFAD